MTEAQRKEAMEPDNTSNTFIKNTGVTTKEARQYAVNLVNKVFGLKSKITGVVFDQSTKLVSYVGTGSMMSGVLAPLTAQLTLLSSPIFFIGILGLARTTVKMTLGR